MVTVEAVANSGDTHVSRGEGSACRGLQSSYIGYPFPQDLTAIIRKRNIARVELLK